MQQENLFEKIEEQPPDWKSELRMQFEAWLSRVEDLDSTLIDFQATEGSEINSIDLYSFYLELCALRNETSKSSRRTSDSFTRLGETLGSFSEVISEVQKKHVQSSESAQLPRDLKLIRSLIDLMGRFFRVQSALNRVPPQRARFWFFRNFDIEWQKRWDELQSTFEILAFHLQEILKSEGISRIDSKGKVFDPSSMVAIAVEDPMGLEYVSGNIEPFTVIEEITPGFKRGEEVIRTAEVRILGKKEMEKK